MQTKYIATALLLAILVPTVTSNLAFAQQYGATPQSGSTLEENLKLAHAKILEVQANPSTGSGTPVFSAGGIVTAMVVVGIVFGGIFIGCVLYARSIEAKRKQVAR